ncbi:lysophospholipase [Westerdykella ornata]|uniref:Lysophospholipase n=1 Tax=Westerdykella ornata TaxID=318751 RepID=A0A6A6JJL8_WESOR|nr:lysophospholipase [Westerdykella ornata]KAF2276687.1 lysophospholipase [Westerdykella ornata]
MKTVIPLLTASTFTCLASASASIGRPEISALEKRATPQAPNGYAPAPVDCPSIRPSIRSAAELSPNEQEWLQRRRANTIEPMRDLLGRLNITGFNAQQFIDNNRNNASALPNIAIAFSGGGYRAMTNGAGALAAFDSRTSNSTSAGQIGGLLQAATYVAGLSGGGWLVGSIYSNNFTSVQNILNEGENAVVWQLGNTILEGPQQSRVRIRNTVDYWTNLYDTVTAKSDAGFETSLTDYWGRALSFQLVNATNGGPAYTFSSIQDDEDFKNANAPMPILVADERAPGEVIISLNSTDFEFNPWEMGSFDPTLFGFAPLRYIGSNFTAGRLPDNERCVRGMDNAGFVMGTSSSLFNQFILNVDSVNVSQLIKNAVTGLLEGIGEANNDIADYTPNPFYHYNNGTNPSAPSKRLTLVDGGSDLQNIPLNPLIQPIRKVDVIFAIDSSADTLPPRTGAQNWPNGTSLVATYQRSTMNSTMQNGTAFPAIPDTNTFVNLGLNNRPTFFGCSAQNLSGPAPLIVYLPNAPYTYNSNTSTFQMQYNNTERNAMILNGYNAATQGNSSLDANWPQCVGCAILSRSFDRTGQTVPDVCKECFDRYCWNGTIASNEPPPYWPQMKLKATKVTGSGAKQFLPNVFALMLASMASSFFLL